ncbi:MAG: nitroreductase family protein [Fervidicoccaceae archaeon]
MKAFPNEAEEKIEFLISRRSVRRFTQENIDDELIEKILYAARYAPSARNSQPWIFIVVREKSLKEELSRIHPYAYPLREAPLGIAVACDKRLSPTSYMLDCANATIYLMLAAHAYGIGTVWIQALRDIEKISELLSLPPDIIPIAIVAMGYPAETPKPRPRKSLDELVFLNRYGERMGGENKKV